MGDQQKPQPKVRTVGGDPSDLPAREFPAYRTMAKLLGRGAGLTEIATKAAELVCYILEAEATTVTRRHGDQLEYIAAEGTAKPLLGRRLPVDDSTTGQVLRSCQPRIFDPRDAPAPSAERARRDNIRSGIIAPVVVDGVAAGTIAAASAQEGHFSAEHLLTIRHFADFIARCLDTD